MQILFSRIHVIIMVAFLRSLALDTLVKLMEYGDDDDDVDDIEHADGAEPLQLQSKSNVPAGPKPFWAV